MKTLIDADQNRAEMRGEKQSLDEGDQIRRSTVMAKESEL